MALCHFAGAGIHAMQRVDADGNCAAFREAAAPELQALSRHGLQ